MKDFALVFPGQGAQFPGMLREYAAHPQAAEALAEASDILSVDLTAMAGEGGGADELNRTENTQPLVLAMDVGVCRALFAGLDEARRPVAVAGHSLGEYAALACAGALSFSDAVRVARFRGEAMARAMPPGSGMMLAALGAGPAAVDAACARLQNEGLAAWAANYNSPMQVVVAGEQSAAARTTEVLKEHGAKRVVALPMSAPSHCPLMAPAAEELAEFLKGIPFHAPRFPVLHNKTAAAADGVEEIPGLLREQATSPVRWIDTVRNLTERTGCLVECGPGAALTGLGKKIAPAATHWSMENSAAVVRTAEALGRS